MMSVPLCSPGEARFQPIQGSITLDHSCPAPLRFHHVGWQSLGVRPRPRLAPFARHVEDKFFIASRTVPFFVFLPRVYFSCISNFHHKLMLVVAKSDSQGEV